MASSPPLMTRMSSAIRDTEEYAAAFDLEVWKAQQQLQFQAQLRQAKEQLERRLRREAQESGRRKMAELEKLRQELETMGQRLQMAGETLEKRTAQLDAREAAFNTKRVKVAEQHEAYVARAEDQARRTREEAQLAQSSLHARLQEKDRTILQLQERVSASQQEYDLLRRRAARYLSEQTDTDGQRLREQECALSLAQTQLAETQRQLREKSADMARLSESKATLEQQLHDAKQQLAAVSRKYHRVREESQAREWERLRREQDLLTSAKRTHEFQARRQQQQQLLPGSFSARGVLDSAAGCATAGSTAFHGAARDDIYEMLAGLKEEVAAGLAAVSRGTPRQSTLPYTIVERPAGSASSITHGMQGERRDHPPTRVPVAAEANTGEWTVDGSSLGGAVLEASSLSGIARVPPTQSPPRPPPAPVVDRPASVVVDMGDTSLNSTYPAADLRSWTTSMIAGEEDLCAPLPPARAGTLPPLAPAQRGLEEEPPDTAAAASPARISPTPEEFVLACAAPVSHTSSAAKAAEARRDMRTFVHQLKLNREKLLETGVYREQDQVVAEMGEKIRLYEQYLAHQPVEDEA
ncbi:hypothetical protein NESM_000775300 [Novymonas esmeraldas]|uniref:Uncharacterized protein n=1 Tax=Novymonas esmeraldas TaxID=1808958 RepID=A0AAW0EXG5_9TRYP